MSKVIKIQSHSHELEVTKFDPHEIDNNVVHSYSFFHKTFEDQHINRNAKFHIHNTTREMLVEDKTEVNLINDRINLGVKEKVEEISDKVKAEAFQLGYQEGLLKGINDKTEEFNQQINNLENIFNQLENYKQLLILDNQEVIIDLIKNLTKKIIYKEIEKSPKLIIDSISQVFSIISSSQNIKISISNEDFELINEIKNQISQKFNYKGVINIETLEGLHKGGCVIETETGDIDNSIETRLKLLDEIVEKLYNENV